MEYVSSAGGLAGIISILIHVVEKFMSSKCHKRFHSTCCKREIDIDMSVDNGTPPTEKPPMTPTLTLKP
jgi:hypothetical protein